MVLRIFGNSHIQKCIVTRGPSFEVCGSEQRAKRSEAPERNPKYEKSDTQKLNLIHYTNKLWTKS